MSRNSLSVKIISAIVFSLQFSTSLLLAGTYSGGAGTPNDPYRISTAEDMNEIGACPNDWDKNFLLINDINLGDFTGTQFNIIGTEPSNPFSGVFDGNGHAILNFRYICTEKSYIALFGCVNGENSLIKDLTMIRPDIKSGTSNYVGSLIGYINDGSITGCYVNGGSISGRSHIGGLVGYYACNGVIEDSHVVGEVTGNSVVGGLVGSTGCAGVRIFKCTTMGIVTGNADRIGGLTGKNNGNIEQSYSNAHVWGINMVGGLSGLNKDYGKIFNCYAKGNVTGFNIDVGGLIGRNTSDEIRNCYSTGIVKGTSQGGLIGINSQAELVISSYWDVNSSGQLNSQGGAGKTTVEMQTGETFIGWNCEPAWTIDEGNDYPRLYWENKPGQAIKSTNYGGGSGEPNNPYLIRTSEQLSWIGIIRCHWDKHFKLMNDIDLSTYSGNKFWAIGDNDEAFMGSFDGNGHTISNFNYTGKIYSGIFGLVEGKEVKISNLGLINTTVNGGKYSYTGSLAAYFKKGSISGCYSKGNSISGFRRTGGLVGMIEDATMTNCYSAGTVSGTVQVGGLVGVSLNTNISQCFAICNVRGTETLIGGLVGGNYVGALCNCYSTGTVEAAGGAGGLAGGNYSGGRICSCFSTSTSSGYSDIGGLVGGNSSTISKSYATGRTSGQGYYIGGVIGFDTGGSYTKCFWDETVNFLLPGIGNATDPEVIGESTTNMQTKTTFTDAGWDFVGEVVNGPNDVWTIKEGQDYPKLIWELVNFAGWYEVDFIDYSYLAKYWQDTNCADNNDCEGADLDFSGNVDGEDLKIFCQHWGDRL